MAMAGPSVGSEVRGCLEHGGEGTLARWRSGWGPPGKIPRWVGGEIYRSQGMKSIEDQCVDPLRWIHPGLGCVLVRPRRCPSEQGLDGWVSRPKTLGGTDTQ